MVVLLMGPAGVGKTTIGRALAVRRGWRFADGDDFHDEASIRRMAEGHPLTELERGPWLQAMRRQIERWLEAKEPAVLAASALKASHRRVLLRPGEDVTLVYLRAPKGRIAQRLQDREGHFMGVAQLDDQLATLEEPTAHQACIVDADRPVEAVVATILAHCT